MWREASVKRASAVEATLDVEPLHRKALEVERRIVVRLRMARDAHERLPAARARVAGVRVDDRVELHVLEPVAEVLAGVERDEQTVGVDWRGGRLSGTNSL
jgi:hypothetical protein